MELQNGQKEAISRLQNLCLTIEKFRSLSGIKPPDFNNSVVESDSAPRKNFSWIREIRTTFNIPLSFLTSRMKAIREHNNPDKTAKINFHQAILGYEKSEELGNISIAVLREFAEAMNMEFIYGFAPKRDYYHFLKDEVTRQFKEDADNLPKRAGKPRGYYDEIIKQKMIQERLDNLPKSFWHRYWEYKVG